MEGLDKGENIVMVDVREDGEWVKERVKAKSLVHLSKVRKQTKQTKRNENKTKQNKTKQNKTKQNKQNKKN